MRLTSDEIKLIVFLLLALTIGAVTKQCRARARLEKTHAVEGAPQR